MVTEAAEHSQHICEKDPQTASLFIIFYRQFVECGFRFRRM